MASVISPLLLSNMLPNDLVVNEIFAKHLYKTIYSVSDTQRDSIEHFHFYFKKIVTKYYNTYDRNVLSEMFFLNVLDNDLFSAIGKDLVEQNPLLAELCSYNVLTEDLNDFVYTVWCCLPTEDKLRVYDTLMNKF
jgi:hypothetical protein